MLETFDPYVRNIPKALPKASLTTVVKALWEMVINTYKRIKKSVPTCKEYVLIRCVCRAAVHLVVPGVIRECFHGLFFTVIQTPHLFFRGAFAFVFPLQGMVEAINDVERYAAGVGLR